MLAQTRQRVALVDADLRRPRVHGVFAIPQSPGFTDLLVGAQAKSTVQHVSIDGTNQLSVCPAGTVPSNPSELLSGRRTSNLLSEMGAYYDYVIADSVPIPPVPDSVARSTAVDDTFVLAHAGRVTSGQIQEVLERLDRVSAPVLGIVLNQAKGGRNDAYADDGHGTLPRMVLTEPQRTTPIDTDVKVPASVRAFAAS